MEKKYIIELPENTHWIQWIMEGTKDHHPYMCYKQVEDLTPYTESDFDAIRKLAFNEGYQEGMQLSIDDAKLKEAYQRGLNDAWDATRKIIHMPEGDLLNIFTECYSAVCTALQVLLKYDASEAIEKIRQYEQEKEKQEKLKKEQSVTAEDVMRQYLDTFCKGRSCNDCPLNTPDFTCGRGYHFLIAEPVSDEEVRRAYAKVLRKMREE